VLQEITLCDMEAKTPEEHFIECAVELICAIGYTLDETSTGNQALNQVCGRLVELKSRKDKKGKETLGKRIQFAIQDLLDMRAASWTKKVFKGTAKTKEEIRQQHDC